MRTESLNGAKYTKVLIVDKLTPDLLTTSQTAALADRSPGTVNRAAAAGLLQAYGHVGSVATTTARRTHYYRSADVHRWIAEGCPTKQVVKVAPEPAPIADDLHDTLKTMNATLSELASSVTRLVNELTGK